MTSFPRGDDRNGRSGPGMRSLLGWECSIENIEVDVTFLLSGRPPLRICTDLATMDREVNLIRISFVVNCLSALDPRRENVQSSDVRMGRRVCTAQLLFVDVVAIVAGKGHRLVQIRSSRSL